MIILLLRLFYVFFRIGVVGFGGGYTMLSMIMTEAQRLGVTNGQIADLLALDLLIPGPIAINAATYTGYISGSSHNAAAAILGSVSATAGVALPSLIIVPIFMFFMKKLVENKIWKGFLSGVKPGAVGLMAAATLFIAQTVLLAPEGEWNALLTEPLKTVSPVCVVIFFGCAFLNIKWKVNPILMTLAAGVAGAFLLA